MARAEALQELSKAVTACGAVELARVVFDAAGYLRIDGDRVIISERFRVEEGPYCIHFGGGICEQAAQILAAMDIAAQLPGAIHRLAKHRPMSETEKEALRIVLAWVDTGTVRKNRTG